MLAAKFRIKDSELIQKVKKQGKLFRSENLAISYLKAQQEESNFAFIISKSISKNATQRNRIKRVLSEAVRQNQSYIKKGYYMIFLPKASIIRKETRDIMNEVMNALKKADLVKRAD
ncbi:ribonuclease P protein component [Candidatus Woesebacteria bacterium]|nr:ribonuclease P protein component [Candidatus Woesebacteria bacterium]